MPLFLEVASCNLFTPVTIHLNITFAYKGRSQICFKHGIDYVGKDLPGLKFQNIDDPIECQKRCQIEPSCNYFVLNLRPEASAKCYLKGEVGHRKEKENVLFGPKHCEGMKLMQQFI